MLPARREGHFFRLEDVNIKPLLGPHLAHSRSRRLTTRRFGRGDLRQDFSEAVDFAGEPVDLTGQAAHVLACVAFEPVPFLVGVFTDFMAQPAPNVSGRLSVNLRGAVPKNTIDQIFYENRDTTTFIKVYQANMRWDDRWFALDAFYRTGHFHWGYEGDFFGLYREANYGLNTDTYDAAAPVGFEVAMKRQFEGLKVAFGPEIWWGAPPALDTGRRAHVPSPSRSGRTTPDTLDSSMRRS